MQSQPQILALILCVFDVCIICRISKFCTSFLGYNSCIGKMNKPCFGIGKVIYEERIKRKIIVLSLIMEKLPNITLKITDGEIQLYGRYKRFTGKRKIYLYLDNKQTYFLDTRNIIEAKFTKSFGLVYDVALKDCSGNTILIEHINQSF